jgi:hypothetical protein
MSDNPDAKPDKPATTEQDVVEVKATGSYFEFPDFTGRLLQNGDTFTTTRARAVELRANGLLEYTDAKQEAEAAKGDVPPSTDGGAPVITTRSIRRRT